MSRPTDISGIHVLVIEDDADNREMLAALLQTGGATVTMAGSSSEAVNAFSARRPDVVVSDLGLPDEDGFSLLARLRAVDPRVRAIALTGRDSPSEVERADRPEFDRYLTKPVSLEEMFTSVARLAGR